MRVLPTVVLLTVLLLIKATTIGQHKSTECPKYSNLETVTLQLIFELHCYIQLKSRGTDIII